MKYVCKDCGSDNIEVKAWIYANNNQVGDWVDDGENECYCNNCQMLTSWKCKYEKHEKIDKIIDRININELLLNGHTTVYCDMPADFDVTLDCLCNDMVKYVNLKLSFNDVSIFNTGGPIIGNKVSTVKKLIRQTLNVTKQRFTDVLFKKMFNQ